MPVNYTLSAKRSTRKLKFMLKLRQSSINKHWRRASLTICEAFAQGCATKQEGNKNGFIEE